MLSFIFRAEQTLVRFIYLFAGRPLQHNLGLIICMSGQSERSCPVLQMQLYCYSPMDIIYSGCKWISAFYTTAIYVYILAK